MQNVEWHGLVTQRAFWHMRGKCHPRIFKVEQAVVTSRDGIESFIELFIAQTIVLISAIFFITLLCFCNQTADYGMKNHMY
jgi:hypothetical protein